MLNISLKNTNLISNNGKERLLHDLNFRQLAHMKLKTESTCETEN
jgi:hypothetical protein